MQVAARPCTWAEQLEASSFTVWVCRAGRHRESGNGQMCTSEKHKPCVHLNPVFKGISPANCLLAQGFFLTSWQSSCGVPRSRTVVKSGEPELRTARAERCQENGTLLGNSCVDERKEYFQMRFWSHLFLSSNICVPTENFVALNIPAAGARVARCRVEARADGRWNARHRS